MADVFQMHCCLPDLVWQRLQMVVGGDFTWEQIRTDAIYSMAASCGYMTSHVFNALSEDPWRLTQGDIALNIAKAAETHAEDLADA